LRPGKPFLVRLGQRPGSLHVAIHLGQMVERGRMRRLPLLAGFVVAVRGGQTPLLTNPQQVVVYADANTQTLGGGVSSNLGRFTGVIFNDNGTLRMDATQVAGGVAE
jgi:hypothetical protein